VPSYQPSAPARGESFPEYRNDDQHGGYSAFGYFSDGGYRRTGHQVAGDRIDGGVDAGIGGAAGYQPAVDGYSGYWSTAGGNAAGGGDAAGGYQQPEAVAEQAAGHGVGPGAAGDHPAAGHGYGYGDPQGAGSGAPDPDGAAASGYQPPFLADPYPWTGDHPAPPRASHRNADDPAPFDRRPDTRNTGTERRTEALRFRFMAPDDLYGPDDPDDPDDPDGPGAAADERHSAGPRPPGDWPAAAGRSGGRHGEFDRGEFDRGEFDDGEFDDGEFDDDDLHRSRDDYLDDDDLGRPSHDHDDELADDLDDDADLPDAYDRRRGARPPGGMTRHRDDARGNGGGGRGRALPKLLAVLVTVAVVLAGLIFVGGKLVGKIGGPPEIPDYPGPGTGSVSVTVAQGASATDIAKVLFDADVVKSEKAFRTAAANNPDSVNIQPGTYTLLRQMSAAGALEALLDPTAIKYRLTISEGRTVDWIITELSKILGVPKDQYEAIAKDPAGHGLKLPAYWKDPGPSAKNKLEGFLFPTTYNLNPNDTPVQTLQKMVDAFVRVAAKLDLEGKAAQLGKTPAEIITIASIIELEVNGHDEGPKVARVIYNRLGNKNGEFNSLGMDSTTRYAFDRFTGPINDLINKYHPYNTRSPQVRGLPPGAIANPGEWALSSALNPYEGADGTWYYFVYLPKSQHTEFATTDAQWAELLTRYRSEGGSDGG